MNAIRFLTDSRNNANTIPVDDFRAPQRFGFGQQGATLAQIGGSAQHDEKRGQVPAGTSPNARMTFDSVEDLGARARLFGGIDAVQGHAAIGLEGEAGYTRIEDRYAGSTQTSETEVFLGLRGRGFAEAGFLGATIGGEAGAGLTVFGESESRRPRDPNYLAREQWQVDLGARAAGRGHLGAISSEARVQAEAGVRGRYQYTQVTPFSDDLGGLFRVKAGGFAGAMASASAKAGLTGMDAGAEAFVGARAGVQAGVGLVLQGQELGTVNVKGEAWAGLGARAHAGLDYDIENQTLTMDADAGVAVGVGGSVGVGATVGGDDFTKSVFDAVA